MELVNKDDWKPVDEIILEENALYAAKSSKSMLVVAGPGAGKSELLAQRACYLLQTNECRESHKILAVSFKKDAACNIEDRVSKRCGQELSKRFISMTFDAFAKSLIDQFLNAIPSEYRPNRDYKIVNDSELIQILETQEICSGQNNNVYRKLIDKLTEEKLPFSSNEKFLINVWQLIVSNDVDGESFITFKMIGRLAEYLIRSNKMLKKVLNMTYSHVFLDEYQDITSIQYELFKTCFYKSDAIITAVGDEKQRIMVWAGALRNAFQKLIEDFDVDNITLIMNHRSAPRLLQIQRALYQHYFYKNNESAIDIVKDRKWNDGDGEAFVHLFNDDVQEAQVLANEVLKLIESGYKKRDICILVKQQINVYCTRLIDILASNGIKARDEARYQDLLKEEIVKVLLSIMTILVKDKAVDEWIHLISVIRDLGGYNQEDDFYKYIELENEVGVKLSNLRKKIKYIDKNKKFVELVNEILEFLNIDKLKAKYPQYSNENTFNKFVEDYCNLLWKEYEEYNNWNDALENFKGEDSIPIMTIHKSKGLEYECVFFIGLEDNAFWSFDRQKNEDFCLFFVALSRAKKRVDFTFSQSRSLTRYKEQGRDKIEEFYSLLDKSGVVEVISYC